MNNSDRPIKKRKLQQTSILTFTSKPTTIKVISGGQTGADRAALRAAQELGLKTGGFVQNGFYKKIDNDAIELHVFDLYEMQESFPTASAALVARSKKNVDASDATIAFRLYSSPGTDKTIGYCISGRWRAVAPSELVDTSKSMRPLLVITDVDDTESAVARIVSFIEVRRPSTLNVCGHRAVSGTARFETAVCTIMKEALKRVFGERK